MNEIALKGCHPTPLAHYLKALGILRLVSEQKDSTARGSWQHDTFVLHTTLNPQKLEEFFLHEYQPSPILSPWNNGSGFYSDKTDTELASLAQGKALRYKPMRESIRCVHELLQRLNIHEKVDKTTKPTLLEACRGALPEQALRWLDAAFLLTNESPKPPPLLGTGGNDGRLEFSQNYMQRLLTLFDSQTGVPDGSAKLKLRGSLYELPVDRLPKEAIGQFFPSAAGGANSTSGFTADSLVNPWDFIFMLEGAVMFASASVRRMHHYGSGILSYPFCVRQSGVGYGSNTKKDEQDARAEIWLPLWSRKASVAELTALFAEGRAQVGRRPARDGVDFARSVASLGVARGIEEFVRFSFQARNGLSYFAIPLGRFVVQRQPQTDLLGEIDGWLSRFRSKASNENAPASVKRALQQLETSIFELCQHEGPFWVQQVLIALGRCQQAMGRSLKWTKDSFLPPIPPLSPQWLQQANDKDSVELRLAASLASSAILYPAGEGRTHSFRFRQMMDPVQISFKENQLHVWWREDLDRDLTWHDGNLITMLNSTFQRQLLKLTQHSSSHYRCWSNITAFSSDIASFIEGQVDEGLLADLLWGCLLLNWPQLETSPFPPPTNTEFSLNAFYTMLKLCYPGTQPFEIKIPINSTIHRQASIGNVERAARLATTRLRGSGLAPLLRSLTQGREKTLRTAAALLFPLQKRELEYMAQFILHHNSTETTETTETTEETVLSEPS